MRNYFILDGVDSRDFGVYISGQGTFSAPARSYELLPVPGRNGDLVGTEKRFENGELTYPAFIYANFKQNIADFRAFLNSLFGYRRLVDSYHPNEYRMVFFQGEFDPDVTAKNDAASFNITFNCKPQRFLLSGEEVVTLDADDPPSETFSGNPATFEADGEYPITDLSADIEPIQDLHGYDNPWPAGGGKNLINQLHAITGSYTNTYFREVSVNAGDISAFHLVAGQTYTLSCDVESSEEPFRISVGCGNGGYSSDITNTAMQNNGRVKITFSATESKLTQYGDILSFRVPRFDASKTFTFTISNIQLEVGSTATPYSPYSNICPISGWTGANVHVSPTTDAQDGTTYSITFPTSVGTVYGGTLDVVTGVLTVDRAMYRPTAVSSGAYQSASRYSPWVQGVMNEMLSSGSIVCNVLPVASTPSRAHASTTPACARTVNGSIVINPYGLNYESIAEARTAGNQFLSTNAIEFCYELATPIVYDLTPTEVTTLLGTNNVWSDAGAVEGEYVLPFTIENPTRFNSQPLLRVYGAGNLGINGDTITISQADVYTDIDCEMMDAFKGTENRNQYITLTNYNFPVLVPGKNNFSLGTGITRVEITPRWWTV